jgi:hypothetical protein
MKLNWTKKQKMEETLKSLSVSTGLEIYEEMLVELKSLWELEALTKKVMDGFPARDKQYHSDSTLGKQIENRLAETKKLLEMVG